MHQINFRPMMATDLNAVMEVEKNAYEFPWTKGIFADCLRVGYECWVATENDIIIAHAVLSVAAGESHILNLAVNRTHQEQGIAKQLLQHLMDLAVVKLAEVMLLEVRQSNNAAIHLYESSGFNEIGNRRGYYPAEKGKEDAIIYAKQL